MKTSLRPRFARGFSLLEVLVAIVILSIGLLALAILQINLIRSSTDAKAQSVALALAKEQLETLRAFHEWSDYIAIADDSFDVDEGGTSYTVATEIQRYALDDDTDQYALQATDAATDAAMTAAGFVAGRDFKRAEVTVTWTEASGGDQFVTLEDVIDGLIPADSARVAKNTSGAKPRTIQVLINDPGAEAGVIPIAINTTDPNAPVSTAATNPKPEIGGTNNSQRVYETRFDVLTYAGLNSGDFLAQARVETTVVSCTCDLDLEDADETGYRPTYWNGERYAAPTLASYTQPAGWTQEGDNNATESAKCTECCRDHHDPVGVTGPKFDPRRVEASQGNQTHTHFNVLSDGTLQATSASGNEYKEACRLIRVDGIFRVAADMYVNHYNLLETLNDGTASEFAPSTAAKANYKNFVLNYLDDAITLNDLSTTFNDLLSDTDVATMMSTYSLDDPATLDLPNTDTDPETDGFWLHSRGLFVDYMEPVTVTAIEDAQENCEGTDGNDPDTDAEWEACVLPLVPFTSINLSELSTWSPIVDDDLKVTNSDFLCSEEVTDNDCDDIDPESPTRGKAYAGDDPTDGNTPEGRSEMLSSTAGIALMTAEIDDNPWFVDGNGDNKAFDIQAFNIVGGGGNNTTYYFTAELSDWMTSKIYSQPIGILSAQECPWGNTNQTDEIGTCFLGLAAGPTSTTISWSNYNFGVTTDSSVANTGSLTLTCTKPNGTTVDKTKSGSGSQKYTVNKCRNFEISSVEVNGTVQTVTTSITGTEGQTNEVTAFTLPITADDEVMINVTEQSATNNIPTTCECTTNACTQQNDIVFATVATCQ